MYTPSRKTLSEVFNGNGDRDSEWRINEIGYLFNNGLLDTVLTEILFITELYQEGIESAENHEQQLRVYDEMVKFFNSLSDRIFDSYVRDNAHNSGYITLESSLARVRTGRMNPILLKKIVGYFLHSEDTLIVCELLTETFIQYTKSLQELSSMEYLRETK